MKKSIFIISQIKSNIKKTLKIKLLLKTLNFLKPNTFILKNNLKVLKKIEHLIDIKKL